VSLYGSTLDKDSCPKLSIISGSSSTPGGGGCPGRCIKRASRCSPGIERGIGPGGRLGGPIYPGWPLKPQYERNPPG